MLKTKFNANMSIKETEVELFAKGEDMIGAKKAVKQELKRLADVWGDQVRIIDDDELAKFVNNDSIMLALRNKGVRAKIEVQRSGST